MTFPLYLRRTVPPTLAALLLSAATMMVAAQPASMRRAGQAGRPAMNAPRTVQAPKQNGAKGNQEHMTQWMERHNNLPLAEQQKALEKEPGFRDLPPQTQQALRNRLTQLNNMPPEQRRRMLEHTETMERLTPQQRQQFRAASEQYRQLRTRRMSCQ